MAFKSGLKQRVFLLRGLLPAKRAEKRIGRDLTIAEHL